MTTTDDTLDQALAEGSALEAVAALAAAPPFTPEQLEAAAEQLFPGIDFARARVQGRIAQAMASIEAALAEAGRQPELRAQLEELLVDGQDFLLTALKVTVAR